MTIFRTSINSANRKITVSGNTVYHVSIGDENHYFGSIAAIFDIFSSEALRVSKSRLWSFGITPERPYRNKVCTIYKGEIHRKKGKKHK